MLQLDAVALKSFHPGRQLGGSTRKRHKILRGEMVGLLLLAGILEHQHTVSEAQPGTRFRLLADGEP